MKSTTRHITSIFFLLLGFLPVLIIIVFSTTQHSIRKAMKEKMETELLHTVVLADNEIQWAKADKEIWIEGKMFDVKSSESRDGFTTFKGLFDYEETLLKTNLKKNWEKNQANQNHLLTQIFQALQNIYFISSVYHIAENKRQSYIETFFSPSILNQFLEIPTPPPLS